MSHTSSRLVRALFGKATDRTPVWLMRQAGRYLPEYRKIRQKAGSFLAMCQDPTTACEITLQPLARFELDAAIIFSDILLLPDALGLGLYFSPGEGPKFKTPITHDTQVEALHLPDLEEKLGYLFEAIRLVRAHLNPQIPVIGFCGSPWTVATYMVEGQSSKQFAQIKGMRYKRPELLTALLTKLARFSRELLIAQAQAGASVLMIFDSWGGVLDEHSYREFSLAHMQSIVADLKAHPVTRDLPVIMFSKNAGQWLNAMNQVNCEALAIDWTTDLKWAREQLAGQKALMGNLDPCALLASPEHIEKSVQDLLAQYGAFPGHIMNLGHGLIPEIPVEHVQAYVQAVIEHSPQYHSKALAS